MRQRATPSMPIWAVVSNKYWPPVSGRRPDNASQTVKTTLLGLQAASDSAGDSFATSVHMFSLIDQIMNENIERQLEKYTLQNDLWRQGNKRNRY
jgi:hypothetical protein